MICRIYRAAGLGAVALLMAANVQAKPIFAQREGKKCNYCHAGAPPSEDNLGYRGLFYKKNRFTFAGFDDAAEAKKAGVPIGPEATPNPKSYSAPFKIPDGPVRPTGPSSAAGALSFALYRGEEDGNVKLGGWGSGRADASKEAVKVGENSIRITTHGLYQGGRLDFKTPVDLSTALANPRCYLRFQMRFSATQDVSDLSGFAQKKAAAPFERLRFVFIMADGSQFEVVRPLDIPPTEDPDSYVPVTMPLAALRKAAKRPLSGAGAQLAGLAICGDKYQQFHIGEVDVLTDDTEISVSPLEDQIAFVNNDMVFRGDAEGGASTLKFSWDWDASDGIQEDDTGRSIVHVFKTEGKKVITLTVSDVDGLKKPAQVVLNLEVSR